jgi:hypothetical protein
VFSLRSYWAGVTHPTNTSYYHCWVWGDVCGAAKHTGGANPNYPDNLPKECYPNAAGTQGALINQHGPNEGKANLYEGCAKVVYPDTYWNFVQCYESQDISRTDPASPTLLMQKCAAAQGMDASKLEKCASDPVQSTAINVANAKATNTLNPAHTGTPWITVDGVSVEAEASELISAICKAYKGSAPKPAACAKFL